MTRRAAMVSDAFFGANASGSPRRGHWQGRHPLRVCTAARCPSPAKRASPARDAAAVLHGAAPAATVAAMWRHGGPLDGAARPRSHHHLHTKWRAGRRVARPSAPSLPPGPNDGFDRPRRAPRVSAATDQTCIVQSLTHAVHSVWLAQNAVQAAAAAVSSVPGGSEKSAPGKSPCLQCPQLGTTHGRGHSCQRQPAAAR